MKKKVIRYKDCTREIIGCAMRVHSEIGNGFQEVIYQRAMEIEFEMQDLEYAREMEMHVYYRNRHVGTRRVDFFVENSIMLELKAVHELKEVHLAQAINYLEAYKVKTGLLINFGSKSLSFKRIYNGKLR